MRQVRLIKLYLMSLEEIIVKLPHLTSNKEMVQNSEKKWRTYNNGNMDGEKTKRWFGTMS